MNKINKYNFSIFFNTLFDVGFKNIFKRVEYEIKKLIYKKLPIKILKIFLNIRKYSGYKINQKYLSKNKLDLIYNNRSGEKISFEFLNEKKDFIIPFSWNNKNWTRLWQFHLNYFDFLREWIDKDLIYERESLDKNLVGNLIDNWILDNPMGSFDGWHSYVTSLRIKNWAILFIFYPDLITTKRIQSLWEQFLYLEANLEDCHGGNHWIENLTALIMVSLQFQNKRSNSIQSRALKLLEIELNRQILKDGGHYERSATYHLIVLDRLIELACFLEAIKKKRYFWLTNSINKMTVWINLIKLKNGNYPRFNDSAENLGPTINEILVFANSYLNNSSLYKKSNSLRSLIIKYNIENFFIEKKNFFKIKKQFIEEIIDLKDTGWTIIRSKNNWETIFKCGHPCPKMLGAHAHSDQLSFEIYSNGMPIISEIGTSIYRNNIFRRYERSSAAHNSLQLGKVYDKKIKWVEPVEVWSSFRVGKKSKPSHRNFGKIKNIIWITGSNNGYQDLKANHKRLILLRTDLSITFFIIIDLIDTMKDKIVWRKWIHFAPNIYNSTTNNYLKYSCWSSSVILNNKLKTSYYAKEIGKREITKLIYSNGNCNIGSNLIVSVLSSQDLNLKCSIIGEKLKISLNKELNPIRVNLQKFSPY